MKKTVKLIKNKNERYVKIVGDPTDKEICKAYGLSLKELNKLKNKLKFVTVNLKEIK